MANLGKAIQGLLGNPAFNLGIGLLAAGSNRRGPKVGFGQGMAEAMQFANTQQGQFNALQAQRQALQAQQRQQKAINQIGQMQQRGGPVAPAAAAQALLGNVPSSIASPGLLQNATAQMQNAQQNHISGLLAQANPQAFTQAAIQQQFPQAQGIPNSAREFMFAASLPPEQQSQYLAQIGRQPTALEQAQLAQILQSFEQSGQAAAVENAQLQQEVITRSDGRASSVREIGKLIDMLSQVRGTVAETGSGADFFGDAAGAIAAGLRLVGANNNSASDVETQISDMDKGFTRLTSRTISDAFLGSDSKVEFYRSQAPGTQQPFRTNLGILKEMLLDIRSAESAASPVVDVLKLEGNQDLNAEIDRLLEEINQIEILTSPGNVSWHDL